uniref:Coactosin-like protein n=1 Tax=Anopheles farauti TaxID=69004 RepID=A0A182Q477_9DIPT
MTAPRTDVLPAMTDERPRSSSRALAAGNPDTKKRKKKKNAHKPRCRVESRGKNLWPSSSHDGAMALPTSLDKDAIREAYEEVRSNLSDHEWAVFKFDGLKIVCSAKGQGFAEFCGEFHDDERAFGYIRMQMGDEMSKRSKFLFLTWIGPEVGVMQRAKMSTDKSIIKDVINNFAVELQVENSADLDLEMFKAHLNKAGGANYGTGVRDL